MTKQVDLPQGALEMLILKAVSLGPLHGYGILLRIFYNAHVHVWHILQHICDMLFRKQLKIHEKIRCPELRVLLLKSIRLHNLCPVQCSVPLALRLARQGKRLHNFRKL